jgi:hypothetical protein
MNDNNKYIPEEMLSGYRPEDRKGKNEDGIDGSGRILSTLSADSNPGITGGIVASLHQEANNGDNGLDDKGLDDNDENDDKGLDDNGLGDNDENDDKGLGDNDENDDKGVDETDEKEKDEDGDDEKDDEDDGEGSIVANLSIFQNRQKDNVDLDLSAFLTELMRSLNTIRTRASLGLNVRKVVDQGMNMLLFDTPAPDEAQIHMHFRNMDKKYAHMVFDFVVSNLQFMFSTSETLDVQIKPYIASSFADVLSAVGVRVVVV